MNQMNIAKGRAKAKLAIIITLMLFCNMFVTNQVYAGTDEAYIIDDSSYSLATYIDWALKEGKVEIKLATDMSSPGNTTIDKKIKAIRGWQKKSFFDDEKVKVRNLGYMTRETITFPKEATTSVDSIKFHKRGSDGGVSVIIEEGATIKFSNCIFANTLVNNGKAEFENCEFLTGEIENNGNARYLGNTVEPKNIGRVSPAPVFENLALVLEKTDLGKTVKGEDFNGEVAFQISGDKKDEAKIWGEIIPKEKGLTVEASQGKARVTGVPEIAGEYKVSIKAESTKGDGSTDLVEKEVKLLVQEPIVAEIRGDLQAYTSETLDSKPKPASRLFGKPLRIDAIASATGGGGGGLGPATPQDKVNLFIKEGEKDFIPYLEFTRLYGDVEVTYDITPAGSGMKASTVYDTIVLSGKPDKVGKYTLVAKVKQGAREVTSNGVEFRIHDGRVSLADRLKALPANLENWDMEPYTIGNTGKAIVPKTLKNIFGSHQSGVYGVIGNAESFDTETITVPSGARLTISNMKVYRNTKIIVEKDAHLTLDDSVAYGPIEINGGSFTMQNSSSIVNSLTLNEGSVLDNAEIKSSKSIIEFINCIDSKNANIVEQQYLISAIETWGELSRELGQSRTIQPYKKNAIKISDLKGGKNE